MQASLKDAFGALLDEDEAPRGFGEGTQRGLKLA
jgi:hypothetical protein